MQNIIEPIFGNYPFEEGWDTEMLEDEDLLILAKQTGVTSVLHYGFIELPRNATHIFEVTLADRVQMNRNRVGMQRLVRYLMKGQNQQSAFMIFHYADQWQLDWRFSYCHYGDREMTTAKRYTFLLGPGQACRTAAQNFCKLFEHRGEMTPDDITAAFDVEALSKEFFNKYKEHYDCFCAYVYNNKENQKLFGEEFSEWEDKTIRDYVKKLLGRIVFLHFLQKKGWMGVPADKPWGEGDRQFMKSLFDSATAEQKANYLDEVLEPLFADALDVDRKANDDLFDCGVEGFRNVKIPYLNGGLFERDKMDEPKSTFSPELFADLFNFLYQYNFTIDENDPNDAEVGVDPEMLGRIFENLLEDNKDKGAFYTPKEIVQYMCKESLIAYLQTDIKSEEMLQRLRDFVSTYDVELIGGADSQTAKDVDDYLKVVKICDPAIGSGAFPMGLMKELYLCRSAIEGFDGKKSAEIKKHIIQKNIYGVDIEKGAVDIARLRFWLSLVLDEETPHALPNLDFKIMQGNSLLEQYKGVDFSHIMHTKKAVEGGVQLSFFENDVDELRHQLVALRNAYYRAKNKQEKTALRASMRNIVQQQIEAQSINIEIGNIDIAETTEFFLWHTWFSEVFDKGGFDIVIGNPPYGAKLSEYEKRVCKNIYRSAKTANGIKGSFDTFAIFIEQGLKLLKEKRSLCFIVPLSVTSSDAMGQLHEIIRDNCETIRVSTYSNRPVQIFESAGLRVAILLCNKTNTQLNHLYTTKLVRRRSTDSLFDIVNNLEFVNSIDYLMRGRFPKVGTSCECEILKLIFNTKKNLYSFLCNDGKPIYYRAAGGRYFNVITDYSTHTSAEKSVNVKYTRQIGLCLSSTIFWFYQQVYTDGLNLKSYEIESFPLPDFTCIPLPVLEQMDELYSKYLQDIESKANIRMSSGNSSYNVSQFKEYKIVRSLEIIRQIDDIVCPLYGLSKEQTEYIKNYEIEYRTVGE